jgi:hypothetical protein
VKAGDAMNKPEKSPKKKDMLQTFMTLHLFTFLCCLDYVLLFSFPSNVQLETP